MSNTYRWAIEQMDAYPEQEGRENVVFNIHWRLYASDGTDETDAYSTTALTLDPESDFIPYEDLTEKEVVGWLKDTIGEEGVTALQEQLDKNLEQIKNPPVVNPPLPWGTA